MSYSRKHSDAFEQYVHELAKLLKKDEVRNKITRTAARTYYNRSYTAHRAFIAITTNLPFQQSEVMF